MSEGDSVRGEAPWTFSQESLLVSERAILRMPWFKAASPTSSKSLRWDGVTVANGPTSGLRRSLEDALPTSMASNWKGWWDGVDAHEVRDCCMHTARVECQHILNEASGDANVLQVGDGT